MGERLSWFCFYWFCFVEIDGVNGGRGVFFFFGGLGLSFLFLLILLICMGSVFIYNCDRIFLGFYEN